MAVERLYAVFQPICQRSAGDSFGAWCSRLRSNPLSSCCRSRKPEEPSLHVLFVCTGNICRSPSAERLAVAYAERLQIPKFEASSAGTRAVIGHPIQTEAAGVLKRLGGRDEDFAARQLTAKVVRPADLVLTMTRAHRDSVLEIAPTKLNRTFTLREASRLRTECGARSVADLPALRPHLAADDLDVEDPIGQSAEVFVHVGQQIADLLWPVMDLCRPPSAQ